MLARIPQQSRMRPMAIAHCAEWSMSQTMIDEALDKTESDRSWRLDHLIQKRHGGENRVSNYLPICTTCNRIGIM
jgi:hypothetical protein